MLTAQETPGVCSALSRPRPQVTPQTEEGVGLAFRFPRGAHADPGAEGPPPAGAQRAPDLRLPDPFTPEPGRCSWGLASKSVARGPATNVQSAPPLCRACGSAFLVLFYLISSFCLLSFSSSIKLLRLRRNGLLKKRGSPGTVLSGPRASITSRLMQTSAFRALVLEEVLGPI